MKALLGTYQRIAVVGMCKHAGKTTVLNALLDALCDETIGITSAGLDGEARDAADGRAKPRIWIKRGTLVATAADSLRRSDITRRLIALTGIDTPLGEVVLLEALSDGFVEISGPSTVQGLRVAGESLLQLGAQRVLIDGALDRLSPAKAADACILVTGAAQSPNLDLLLQATVRTANVLKQYAPLLFVCVNPTTQEGLVLDGDMLAHHLHHRLSIPVLDVQKEATLANTF